MHFNFTLELYVLSQKEENDELGRFSATRACLALLTDSRTAFLLAAFRRLAMRFSYAWRRALSNTASELAIGALLCTRDDDGPCQRLLASCGCCCLRLSDAENAAKADGVCLPGFLPPRALLLPPRRRSVGLRWYIRCIGGEGGLSDTVISSSTS